jgi:hypothetical protein
VTEKFVSAVDEVHDHVGSTFEQKPSAHVVDWLGVGTS